MATDYKVLISGRYVKTLVFRVTFVGVSHSSLKFRDCFQLH